MLWFGISTGARKLIRRSFWRKVPSNPIAQALPKLLWKRTDGLSAAGGTAALMIYVALIFLSEDLPSEEGDIPQQLASATYDQIAKATGISRLLISEGIKRLSQLDLIESIGSNQKRQYKIKWDQNRWFKLPCQAIVASDVIRPFIGFTMRSKYELYAMKLYLYLALRRDNRNEFSMASYENLHDNLHISERDIRKAISLLITTGLFRSVDRERMHNEHANGPNKYYLAGSTRFFNPNLQKTGI